MRKLIECIPNFSTSRERDAAAFDALIQTALSVPGCTLLDTHSDGNHNRCVLTLLGSPSGIAEAAFRLCETAVRVIDLTKHRGAHPRMGAADVIPFVTISGVTLQDCVALSAQVAERVWKELSVPSFLYEQSATVPEHRNLADCRRGQFEGMNEKLQLPEWAPDFGERQVHPTAGISAIGARQPLIAFNVNLNTGDVNIAKRIAKKIRGSSGGFPCCKALGLLLEDRGIAQVSMNLVNYEVTPVYQVYDEIARLAREEGVEILCSELVGMSPAKAMLDCAAHYLKLEEFDPGKRVIECRILDME